MKDLPFMHDKKQQICVYASVMKKKITVHIPGFGIKKENKWVVRPTAISASTQSNKLRGRDSTAVGERCG
jgi:hypothetical protein